MQPAENKMIRENSAADISATVKQLRMSLAERTEMCLQSRMEAFDSLAKAMLQRDPALGDYLRRPGVAFLAGFLQRPNLESLLSREFPDPIALERFVPAGGRKSIRVAPRGLVCHWLAGNVPLLGALSWSISALVGNVNLLRLSSRQEDPIGPLLSMLKTFGDAGRQIANETAVVRFDRDDREAHCQMSETADVRLAWGGRDAVDAVRTLPCRWECEDLILGPRTSLAVIDPGVSSQAILDRLATDIAMFDQQACSSPQVVFVRTDADCGIGRAFLEGLAKALEQASRRFARHSLDAGETYRISLDRTRVLLTGGQLERDTETQWTLAVLPKPDSSIRCVNRFVQVVPFSTPAEVIEHVPPGVQTVVTSLPPEQHREFSEKAAFRGVCRMPSPGEGNFFESPWDGIPLASRLTRWVTRTDPRD